MYVHRVINANESRLSFYSGALTDQILLNTAELFLFGLTQKCSISDHS